MFKQEILQIKMDIEKLEDKVLSSMLDSIRSGHCNKAAEKFKAWRRILREFRNDKATDFELIKRIENVHLGNELNNLEKWDKLELQKNFHKFWEKYKEEL